LPVFANLDLIDFCADSDLRKLAKHLRYSLSDASRHAKKLSKSRRISKSHSMDKRSDARRGSSKSKGLVDEDETRSSKKKKCTVKYSYSNWSRYFFGDFLNGEFVPASDDILVDLKEAIFIAYWLSKYVFLGPADECMSQGVFLLACVIAEGRRVPLAPLYLGGLYARLVHFSEQLRIADGRFAVLAYIDEIFLQLFLFEHFPQFAPSRKLPTILPIRKRALVLGHGVLLILPGSWRKSLTWRKISPSAPYISSLHSDAFDLHQFYSSDLENDRNEITTGKEGAYDFWLLCTSPTPLPEPPIRMETIPNTPHLLCKMKTIPNTPNDPVDAGDEDSQDEDNGGYSSSSPIGGVSGEVVAQDIIQDNPQVVAECDNNVDSGVPYE
ncbi:hypothetical protein PIB30_066696, partial [Stylosanthes scabra]|nr:hypothetical protein [Stylosanthes scabra]